MALGKNLTWKKGKGELSTSKYPRIISSGVLDGNFWEENQDLKWDSGKI